jgi:hypothetical protein
MGRSRERSAVPLFGQDRAVPPSRPSLNPPPRAAAIKSLSTDCNPRGGGQTGA